MIPPQHSITATITYISPAAFDVDRVTRERATMPDGGDGHPVVLYFAGASRYDLGAMFPVQDVLACAREYLRPEHKERVWTLRRLRTSEVARCRDVGGKTGQLQAFALAAGEGRPLTESQIDALADEFGTNALCDVGEAALLASEAPKASEKKP